MSESTLHVQWVAWDGTSCEHFRLRWENGGWVGEGTVSGPNIQYVFRLGPDHDMRQLLLFRDLDEPDLWLVTDGKGRWGEMNGAVRDDLTGCNTLSIDCSPSFTLSVIRSLQLKIGEQAVVRVASIDVETLAIRPLDHTYTRFDTTRWGLAIDETGFQVVFDVDADDVLTTAPGWFSRIATTA